MSFIDVENAHLRSELFVELQLEANEPPDIVWRLQLNIFIF